MHKEIFNLKKSPPQGIKLKDDGDMNMGSYKSKNDMHMFKVSKIFVIKCF